MLTKGRTSLVVMTKFPEAGKVKTRLAKHLGADEACKLHIAMVHHQVTHTIPALGEINVQFHVAGGTMSQVRDWLEGQSCVRQIEGGLGLKMQAAIQSCFDQGSEKVLIIGTDAPTLSAAHVLEMEQALDQYDVVFNPATDGGYVMAGMKQVHPQMFHDISWSTADVLQDSVAQLEAVGKTVGLLETLPDVDTIEDLEIAVQALGSNPWKD